MGNSLRAQSHPSPGAFRRIDEANIRSIEKQTGFADG
jgi:hypothetical protein